MRMLCTNCGNSIPDQSSICPNCGSSQVPAAAAAPASVSQQMPPPAYAPGPYQQVRPDLVAPLSVWDYVIMFILQAIPIVGIVMLFVWAFGDSNINKKNYARAALLMVLVAMGLMIVLGVVFGIIAALAQSSR